MSMVSFRRVRQGQWFLTVETLKKTMIISINYKLCVILSILSKNINKSLAFR